MPHNLRLSINPAAVAAGTKRPVRLTLRLSPQAPNVRCAGLSGAWGDSPTLFHNKHPDFALYKKTEYLKIQKCLTEIQYSIQCSEGAIGGTTAHLASIWLR